MKRSDRSSKQRKLRNEMGLTYGMSIVAATQRKGARGVAVRINNGEQERTGAEADESI
jgi:hypothetical protein